MKRFYLLSMLMLCSIALFAGGSKEASNISVITREDGSGTRGAFTELVGLIDSSKIDQTTPYAEVANSTSVVITTVNGNRNSIGYISLGSLNDSVKAVKIDGIDASQANIENGSYKLQRPFNIAFRELSPIAEDFLSFVFSSQGQSIVAKSGYIAVAEGERYVSGSISGKLTISGSSSVYPLMEKLIEAYKSMNPLSDVTLQQSDSSTGIKDVINGISDIGMASRDLKQSELDSGIASKPIAIDGIAVIVNKDNSISDLSIDQLREIYLGQKTTWN